ncbi:hypothetical protein SAMN04515674_101477 [Pseudarcicella hirudinis]|uniref:Uncharacterized protein n=1 Tax=Pseudarcicella hirudinis TaxID=1079859 RepID=A0A1I5MXE4_9BACT|nr:hypothetical protein [Pseudarcicella hirudinis]SFP13806.1 hypothetical protein SAMN04515674_101477 [Pseudarcicella hirudinis]
MDFKAPLSAADIAGFAGKKVKEASIKTDEATVIAVFFKRPTLDIIQAALSEEGFNRGKAMFVNCYLGSDNPEALEADELLLFQCYQAAAQLIPVFEGSLKNV